MHFIKIYCYKNFEIKICLPFSQNWKTVYKIFFNFLIYFVVLKTLRLQFVCYNSLQFFMIIENDKIRRIFHFFGVKIYLSYQLSFGK